MTETDRIKELEKLISRHQELYYNAEPEISDAEFDALWDELRELSPNSSLFKTVPEDKADGFPKAEHIIPMGSQEKAANPDSFLDWAKKSGAENAGNLIVQYKLDGASLELQYEDGIFTKAVTRGNGRVGDDITCNAKKMQGLVFNLMSKNKPVPFTGGIRSEVIMTKNVHVQFFSDKANCRNAANGLMKRKDGMGCEHLTVICYDAVEGTVGKPFTGKKFFETEIEKTQWLSELGFKTVPQKICATAQEVIDYRSSVMDIRPTLEYDIDGLVVKTNEIDAKDLSRARPEKQIAFKFSLEEAVSTVLEIEWSESGATYTPIAIIEPVHLAGTTVRRASLANPNIIKSLGLKIGSKVVITKRGEIIPKIESLVENPASATEIVLPEKCVVCQTKLLDEGTRLYCPNPNCPKLIHHRIEKWVSTLDIRDLGTTLIRRLFDTKRLNSISDIYTLTVSELAELDRMGQRSAEKVINAINSKTEISLAKFIAGFDIEGIGEVMAEKLIASGYDTLEKLLDASEEELSNVYQFGKILAKTLSENLEILKPEMTELVNSGKLKIKPPVADAPLKGLSFCFTGELYTMKRAQAQALVKEKGGAAKSSVVKDLTYLVTNTPESGSSKNKKAQSLNISIITEEEFLKIVNG
ncbi:MAG: DNA ligase (NAD(+)) LigA [Treponema sp.]|nr:MAG: DNA ligase (NAD(+)) LigA [Treponema sp.]